MSLDSSVPISSCCDSSIDSIDLSKWMWRMRPWKHSNETARDSLQTKQLKNNNNNNNNCPYVVAGKGVGHWPCSSSCKQVLKYVFHFNELVEETNVKRSEFFFNRQTYQIWLIHWWAHWHRPNSNDNWEHFQDKRNHQHTKYPKNLHQFKHCTLKKKFYSSIRWWLVHQICKRPTWPAWPVVCRPNDFFPHWTLADWVLQANQEFHPTANTTTINKVEKGEKKNYFLKNTWFWSK